MSTTTFLRKAVAVAAIAASATVVTATSSQATYRGTEMVSHARAYVGQWGGQCKAFVQKIHNEVYVSNLGTGYYQAYIDAGYHRVAKSEVVAGDIIQETDSGTHTVGIHTAIVISDPDGPTIKVIDSNWVAYETVGVHTYDPTAHAASKRSDGVAYYWHHS